MVGPILPVCEAALIALDHLNVEDTFKQRASVMKVVPKFLRGLC